MTTARRPLPPPPRVRRRPPAPPTPSADEAALLTTMQDDHAWHTQRVKLLRLFSIAEVVNVVVAGRFGAQSRRLDATAIGMIRDCLSEGVTAFKSD
jgi:hypothetical protein